MKKLALAGCLILSLAGFSQNENKKWYFGANAGLDFTSGSPVPLTGGALNTPDCSATISDAAGNVLFYSNGVTVWNRQHNVMSNGSGLLGNSTGGQPATIVPHPGNPNLYYLFSCDAFAGSNGIRYSIIDMSLQSGLGAVTSTKNVVVYTPATEKVISVRHCNGRDYWLITHNWNNNEFRVYLIDINGFNSVPVSSSVGATHTGGTSGTYNACGQISVSQDGSRIGLALYSAGVIEVLDFNNSTGQVTNPIHLTGFTNAWGVEFSPNGKVLYTSRWQGSGVWQVDLLAGNTAAIQASKTLVGTPTGPHPSYLSGYLKRGPDGKIYCAKYNSQFLAVINNPNTLGSGCGFVDNGLNLGGPLSQVGFDNCTVQTFSLPTISVSGNCSSVFGISDTTGLISASWNFGDPASGPLNTASTYNASHTFTSSGSYTVQLILNYACFTDTLTQVVTPSAGSPNAQFLAAVNACDSFVVFSNMTSNGSTYSWNFGDGDTSTAANPGHTYSGPGTYTATLIASNACGNDTIVHTVTVPSVPVSTITGTDTICAGQSATLTAAGGNSVQWSGGSTATTYTISVSPQTTTTYYATTANWNCPSEPDTFTVFVRPAPSVSVTGTSGICAGQGTTLTAIGNGSFQWSGGSSATTPSITVNPLTTTNYYVTVTDSFCTSMPDTFTVTILPTPIVTIFGPTTICIGQTVTLAASGASSYQWSGGANDTTAAITVSPTTTTTYYALPGASACPGIPDTITVTVLPTPIVNVGGNTSICAGQSTTLTATGGTSFQWSGGSTDTTASITVSPVVTTTYFVTTSNGPCTSGYDTITVVVTPSPAVNIVAPAMICPGTTLTLTAVGNATTYVWGGGASGTGTTITDNPTSATNYYVIGYNNLGCSDTDMVNVGLYDVLNAAILGDDSICVGEATALSCAGSGTFAWAPPTGLNTTTGANVIATPATTTTYTVTFTDVHGCITSDAVSIQVDQCVGINEISSPSSSLNVYPNPATGSVWISTNITGAYTLEIVDVLGQTVFSSAPNSNVQNMQIDVSTLADGTYMVILNSGHELITGKLIIAK